MGGGHARATLVRYGGSCQVLMVRSDLQADEPIATGVESALLDVRTVARGNVLDYNETAKTCTVRLATKHAVPDDDGGFVFVNFPDLPNVPVAWPSAGGFMLHFPLPAGSSVFVTFDEIDCQQWEKTGEVSEPAWLERHGLSCPLAHPYSRTPIATSGANMPCPTPFSFGDAAAAKALAVAEKVSARLDAIQTKFDAHTHPVPGVTVGPGATVSSVTGTLIGPLAAVDCAKLKAE